MVFQQPNLYLPPQGAPPGDLAPTSPRNIRSWLAHLPTDDPVSASSRLFSTLVRLNGYILEPSDRFKALELIRETHDSLRKALRERYLKQRLPLDGESTRLSSLVRRLDDAMATGYKLVIADLSGRSEAGMLFRRRTMPLAVYRALSHLGASISDAYEVYVPPSPPLWHDLHELFNFARVNGLQERALKLEQPDGLPTPTIAGAYKAVLLLSLANPFRLHHGDVPRTCAKLRAWADQCSLQSTEAADPPAHRVGVVTARARPPEFLRLDTGNIKGVQWFIDTLPLAQQLTASSDRASPDSDTQDAAQDVGTVYLKRLAAAWGVRGERRYPRTPATARVEASLGLHQLHHLIELAGPAAPGSDLGANARPETPAGDVNWKPQIEVWRMKDRSPGGYRLSLEGGQAAHTTVGELIGVRGYPPKSLAAGGWRVGVVRWLRNVPGNDLEAGVEWLAPTAQAVTVQTLRPDGHASSRLEGLMLPKVRVYDRAPTLVTPAFVDGSTHSVRINELAQPSVNLTGEEENTGEHARFWYTADDKPEPSPAGADHGSEPAPS